MIKSLAVIQMCEVYCVNMHMHKQMCFLHLYVMYVWLEVCWRDHKQKWIDKIIKVRSIDRQILRLRNSSCQLYQPHMFLLRFSYANDKSMRMVEVCFYGYLSMHPIDPPKVLFLFFNVPLFILPLNIFTEDFGFYSSLSSCLINS